MRITGAGTNEVGLYLYVGPMFSIFKFNFLDS